MRNFLMKQNEMKKVLYITNVPSPYRVEFFNELSKICELTVAFERVRAMDRNINWKSEEKYCFHPVFMRTVHTKIKEAFCPEVIHLIEEHKKGTIIIGGYSTPTCMYGILYMRMNRIPFLLNCDGGMIKEETRLKKKVKKFFIGSASGWLSTGRISDAYLIYYGAKKERIYHYPFTSVKEVDITETTQEEKKEIREKLGIKEEKVILFVGSFIYRKGIDILLKAYKRLDNNTAVVLVGGKDLSEYEKILDSNIRSRVYAVGFKMKKEMSQYYRAADIFVFPTREDIWGLVVNEAMAYGLPVVTTNQCVAGLELIRDDINGYTVPIDSVKELAAKINKLLNDRELREKIGRNNLEKIKEYTIEKMAEQHNRIIYENEKW